MFLRWLPHSVVFNSKSGAGKSLNFSVAWLFFSLRILSWLGEAQTGTRGSGEGRIEISKCRISILISEIRGENIGICEENGGKSLNFSKKVIFFFC
ncbi:hypothetical protein VIGAN_11202900 [Vigna angularis var. angularis]|uniref:Uncharacterized protein n=1 Tax=Vigna angularis var. angularis TaxID=157739 RepID=A0A0S3TBJ5_PHAAN|nr:hypothetical protein VIGAN_11202900 [Vigna angularis var. angularis]